MIEPAYRCALGLLALRILVSCASVATTPPSAPVEITPDQAFIVDGRISARRGGDAITANFTWRHDTPRDELSITTPLGQEIADLHGDTRLGRVEVRTSDGRVAEAADWPTMTERALGYRLPVDALAAWLRGAPYGPAPHTIERDAAGRPLLLRQQGWEIVYSYPDESARRPSRLRVTYPDLEMRIVIDRWS